MATRPTQRPASRPTPPVKSTARSGLGLSSRPLALLAIGLVLALGAYLVLLRPSESTLAETKGAAEQISAQAARTRARTDAVRSAGPDALAAATTAAANAEQLVPPAIDGIAVPTSLQRLGDGLGLVVSVAATELPEGLPTNPAPTAFDVTVTGPPDALSTFTTELTKLRPLITVRSATFTRGTGDTGASLKLTVLAWSQKAAP